MFKISISELHYESMEVVEEERSPKTGITVHQLPRPATTVLYTHPAILINDFLFEADNVEDAQKNFDDMMDLQTSIGTKHLLFFEFRLTNFRTRG